MTEADSEPGLRLAASLRDFWQIRGHVAEGADVLQAILELPGAREAALPRARALVAAANLLVQADGYAIAEDYCKEALAIARAADDDHLVADVLQIQAWPLLRRGQPDTALPLIEQGLGLARCLQEPHLTGRLLSARSFALNIGGDPAGAARDAAESLRLYRQAGDRIQVGATLGNLGNYELAAGDVEAARRHLVESLDIARLLNARDVIVYWTFNLGLAEYLGGSTGAAEALFAESLDLAWRAGMETLQAYALIGLAMAGRSGADPGWSARLHGAAEQAMADLGVTIEPLEERLAGLDRQRLRAAMGAEAYEAEYAAGRALDLASVTDQALHRIPAGREEPRASALASEPDSADSGEAVAVLTPRELEVLKLAAQGLSNPDIGRRLTLSEHTVHRHLTNILRKLGLSSRVAAAAWGARNGLL